jgi:hypothetical protein|tara:strand:- start:308 stop:460 length:153 start_codon:yes stop_codon:yes gene_type:complete
MGYGLSNSPFFGVFNKWEDKARPPPLTPRETKADRNCFNEGSYLLIEAKE